MDKPTYLSPDEWPDWAKQLSAMLPPVVARGKAGELTGGAAHPRTLANDDSKGIGPRNKIRLGARRVAYTSQDLVEYLARKAAGQGGSAA